MDYALDRHGARVYPGDYVEVLTDQYFSLRKGARCRVKAVDHDGDCIVLNNKYSPVFDSPYRAENFRLSGRYHPFHHGGVDKRHPRDKYLTNSEKGKTNMLHLALKVPEGWNYENLANSITNFGQGNGTLGVSLVDQAMADTTASALKERIRARIHHHPDERWLILSGNTIAESAAPPVAFRQW